MTLGAQLVSAMDMSRLGNPLPVIFAFLFASTPVWALTETPFVPRQHWFISTCLFSRTCRRKEEGSNRLVCSRQLPARGKAGLSRVGNFRPRV
jgi:hypothetical protein